MTCGVGMRWWAGAGTTWPKAFCLGRVCAGGRPGKRGRSAARQRRAWRTWGACCLRGRRALPRIDEPDLLVTGARPDAGGRLGAGGGGLAPGSGPARTAAVGARSRARVVRTWHMRVGLVPGSRFGRRHRPAGSVGRRAPDHGPTTASRTASREGRGLGEPLTPDPTLALVDLTSQVRVETSQHAQRRSILIRGAHGAQGMRQRPGRAGDHHRVLRVGPGAARRQIRDAAHRQPRQMARRDAHTLDHHQNP